MIRTSPHILSKSCHFKVSLPLMRDRFSRLHPLLSQSPRFLTPPLYSPYQAAAGGAWIGGNPGAVKAHSEGGKGDEGMPSSSVSGTAGSTPKYAGGASSGGGSTPATLPSSSSKSQAVAASSSPKKKASAPICTNTCSKVQNWLGQLGNSLPTHLFHTL